MFFIQLEGFRLLSGRGAANPRTFANNSCQNYNVIHVCTYSYLKVGGGLDSAYSGSARTCTCLYTLLLTGLFYAKTEI